MPAFSLSDSDGKRISSADLLRRGPLVIYFYPKDETLGCTIEACAFRDEQAVFDRAGAVVVGISPDRPEAHRRFADRHGLQFTLLSDPDKSVFRRFGVTSFLGLITGRETFVVDREGIIRHHLRANLSPKRHVTEAATAVGRL